MIARKDIPKDAELFTSAFYSERDAGAPKSFYTFGWIDTDLVSASGQDIHWTDIDNSQGFWKFPSTSVTINGKKITQSGNTAIADTGTTLALVSDEVCDALYKAIPGATYDQQNQGYVFPTSTKVEDLPEFSVAIGDKEFVIQKEDLAFAPADDTHWYGGVQSRGTMEFDILGDTFLKSVYSVSIVAEKQVNGHNFDTKADLGPRQHSIWGGTQNREDAKPRAAICQVGLTKLICILGHLLGMVGLLDLSPHLYRQGRSPWEKLVVSTEAQTRSQGTALIPA